MTPDSKTALVTGAGGFLGGCVTRHLRGAGWGVIEMSSRADGKSDSIGFRLGDEIAPGKLAGASALVHCAYDFKALSWKQIHDVNVAGSEKLLRAGRAAGVPRIIYISSISAYEGCRSLY